MKFNIFAGALNVIQYVIGSMDENTKKLVDEAIDKLEDKYDQGSWEDIGMETACKVLRGTFNIEDYPDDDEEGDSGSTD